MNNFIFNFQFRWMMKVCNLMIIKFMVIYKVFRFYFKFKGFRLIINNI